MPEPTTTTAGSVSLTVIAITLLGPLAGPYVLIAVCSIAGSLWPLSAARTAGHRDGLWLLLRCTLTAIVLTSLLASMVERVWAIPVSEGLGPVALLIGSMGNGWRPVFAGAAAVLRGAIPGQQSGGRE